MATAPATSPVHVPVTSTANSTATATVVSHNKRFLDALLLVIDSNSQDVSTNSRNVGGGGGSSGGIAKRQRYHTPSSYAFTDLKTLLLEIPTSSMTLPFLTKVSPSSSAHISHPNVMSASTRTTTTTTTTTSPTTTTTVTTTTTAHIPRSTTLPFTHCTTIAHTPHPPYSYPPHFPHSLPVWSPSRTNHSRTPMPAHRSERINVNANHVYGVWAPMNFERAVESKHEIKKSPLRMTIELPAPPTSTSTPSTPSVAVVSPTSEVFVCVVELIAAMGVTQRSLSATVARVAEEDRRYVKLSSTHDENHSSGSVLYRSLYGRRQQSIYISVPAACALMAKRRRPTAVLASLVVFLPIAARMVRETSLTTLSTDTGLIMCLASMKYAPA